MPSVRDSRRQILALLYKKPLQFIVLDFFGRLFAEIILDISRRFAGFGLAFAACDACRDDLRASRRIAQRADESVVSNFIRRNRGDRRRLVFTARIFNADRRKSFSDNQFCGGIFLFYVVCATLSFAVNLRARFVRRRRFARSGRVFARRAAFRTARNRSPA